MTWSIYKAGKMSKMVAIPGSLQSTTVMPMPITSTLE
jgi:hypothetical protein